ncbi:YbaB/EbfC family nucleoid-associated protein [Saccharopolyspora indica]|uniref:YbaB/EbfC family nucleoid-associated protein n=1 Tax=Saccharopolyspora indica TaxID=1229659 RepID=UPI0022EB1073|nr:YbaB/EbfC family nucleoid-associated protein [Saccharopolyspora indica]MDA3643704.1 YbaB/EbfC family nucleoid-associated protein [Saccharopolyspora indica]
MPPDFGADPAQADRAVRAWAQGLQEKANRVAAMQQEIGRIRITERSRSVTVTIDAEGIPVDVRFADQRASGAELSAEFMAVLRRAQSRIADAVTETTRTTLGDQDPTTANAVTSNYRQRFPAEAPAVSPPPGPTAPVQPRTGPETPASPPPGPPAAPTPPPTAPPTQTGPAQAHGPHDDGDFSDETFLN